MSPLVIAVAELVALGDCGWQNQRISPQLPWSHLITLVTITLV